MTKLTRLLMATGLMVTATAASAHAGHDAGHDAGTGFTSGLLHPMLGLDHLLAMVAIGFWSVRQSATLKNSTPLFVIGGMILGAGIAWGGLSLPGVETGIALSVLLAGILIATMAKLPTAVGGSLVAAFMVFHGFAHGAEMPAGATLVAYFAGFSVATLALTFAGCGFGALLLKSDSRITRAIGAVLVGAGVMFAG
ncbi:urease accessory protein [Marinobacter sp. LV10R510-11A]|uniref:HupE/UreJ family protein n=1 Tax=Marinobacter sp. LV10R510-11A TaxID=1415568 RepID=UPI000BB6B0F3|nr:HupE/UreJ family protein [Marinobacter sp. LV10R510-11A]SOB78122.1 urease accessory protein [Marinobacter sp. LV10R510-11A]